LDEPLDALASLRHHWPEYLMETAELGVYMFAACAFATLLEHPDSPLRAFMFSSAIRRALMGIAMGATVIAIILSPWGKQSGGHFNPAITFTFYRLGKVGAWDLVYYISGHFVGAIAGVALAALLLRGAHSHRVYAPGVRATGAPGGVK
jgi:aquaporin Z